MFATKFLRWCYCCYQEQKGRFQREMQASVIAANRRYIQRYMWSGAIAVEMICYGLSRATRPSTTPESLFEEGRAPTFGDFRSKAQILAATKMVDDSAWGARFFARVMQDERQRVRWKSLMPNATIWLTVGGACRSSRSRSTSRRG